MFRSARNIRHIVTLTSVLSFCNVYGQSDTSALNNANRNLVSHLPPLHMLIDSALANSPEMIISEYNVTNSESEVIIGTMDWTELIGVSGRYTYGQFISNEGFGFALSQPIGGYQISAGVSLPLGYFASRSQKVEIIRTQLEIQKQQNRQTEMAIREQIIEMYNQLVLLQRLISITAEARESAILQYQMAEDRFREGQSSLEELASATNMRANFASVYEQQRAEFGQSYAALERLVGTPFSKFPKQ